MRPLRALLLLVPPGLEALAAEEAAELEPGAEGAPAGPDLPGRLLVREAAALDWRSLRLPKRAARWVAELPAGDLDGLRRALEPVAVPELEGAASFRVTAHAAPGAALSAREAARAAGGVLHRRSGVPVDLEGFEVEVRLDLAPERAWLSVELQREALDARFRRARPLRSALKPSVAAGLVRLAGLPGGGGSLLDPTCGSGTILFEAHAADPDCALFGSDWDAETVATARASLSDHGVPARVEPADARELASAWGRRFDAVAFNPPYGLQVGRRARMDRLYSEVLRSVEAVLGEGGRVVVLTPRRKALAAAAAAAGLELRASVPIEMGGLRPVATVLARS